MNRLINNTQSRRVALRIITIAVLALCCFAFGFVLGQREAHRAWLSMLCKYDVSAACELFMTEFN